MTRSKRAPIANVKGTSAKEHVNFVTEDPRTRMSFYSQNKLETFEMYTINIENFMNLNELTLMR